MSNSGMRLPGAVVFDLDGTLVDSAPDIARALNTGLATAGVAPFDIPAVKAMVGGGIKKLVERALAARGLALGTAAEAELIAATLAAYAAHPCDDTILFPDALTVLQDLRASGVAVGVCTNKPAPLVEAIVDKLGLLPLLDTYEAGGALPLKPAPDMLQAVLARLGAAPAAAAMVGDSSADVGAARAAGVRVVLLAHGYSKDPVASLGADAVVEGFKTLPAALQGLPG